VLIDGGRLPMLGALLCAVLGNRELSLPSLGTLLGNRPLSDRLSRLLSGLFKLPWKLWVEGLSFLAFIMAFAAPPRATGIFGAAVKRLADSS